MQSQKPASHHAYGIGIIALVVGLAIGISYYQIYYLPEAAAKPKISEEILEPTSITHIDMIYGSANQEQNDNFVPKQVLVQLGLDNRVVWENRDDTAHTVTPDFGYEFTDKYSGEFGSVGFVMPGERYEFLFTQEGEIKYHCDPHPWMTGTIKIEKSRF